MNRGKVFTIILQPETDPDFEGYYNASVPALPGCFSYGATREEALYSIKEAIDLYLEDLEATGEPVPDERIEIIELAVWSRKAEYLRQSQLQRRTTRLKDAPDELGYCPQRPDDRPTRAW